LAKDEEVEITLTTLEAPPAPDMPAAGGPAGVLIESDSLGILNAKVAALESFLALATRDVPFEEFTRELLMVFLRVVKSEAGSLFELDHRHQQLFFRAIVGSSSDKLAGMMIPLGTGIVGHVAESRQPLVVDDVGENRLHLKAVQEAVGFATRNLVAVPILIRGKVYGVLELLNRVGEESYAADVELLSYLCESAARAIELRLMIAWAMRAARGGRRAGDGDPGSEGERQAA
jgi:GAF domain-containing protein